MHQRAVIVTDIGYGDAGKGTTVDYFARQAVSPVVIRHNGGPQAAHNVVTEDGRHHTFSQFGSGSFVPGVQTYLSRHMLINPRNMFPEAEHLIELGIQDIWERISVDRDAMIITPWHCEANQLRERARGSSRHGSCGQGVGEVMADALEHPELVIRVRDIQTSAIYRKLEVLRQHKLEQLRQSFGAADVQADAWRAFVDPLLSGRLVREYRHWASRVTIVDRTHLKLLADRHDTLIFEGSQGVLLDEWRGFHPYTTWSTTTHANATALLSEIDFAGEVTRLGVMRAYATRHGAGPFVTEDASLEPSLKEYFNGTGLWQGAFRYGYLDMLAHRYALAACGETDALVMTGLDRMRALPNWYVCDGYRLNGSRPDAAASFDMQPDGLLSSIKLGPYRDLSYQARLTELLLSCSPVYRRIHQMTGEPLREQIHCYLQTTEDRLGLPISLVSFGPTAADKRAITA